MGAEGIFLASGGGLVVMGEQPYASEAVLQRALEEHPEVIAGSSTTDSRAGQLILVKREMGVPGSEGGSSTWSLDHLFLDAQGVPVVVEVKRSSDTRIRREVVGQMLDYAANGVRYWPIENIKAAVESTAQAQGRSADNAIEESSGLDPEEYWNLVEANLRAGRIRMLFVADALPPELVRIIEFLNEQMSPAEVLGVELRQYVGGEHVAYVPSVVGRTTAAVKLKTTTRGEQWSEESLLEAAQARCSEPEVALIRRLFDDVHRRGERFSWGRGATPGVSGWYRTGGKPAGIWTLNAGGEEASAPAYLYFYFPNFVDRIPVARIEDAAQHLETVPGFRDKIRDARAEGWRKRYPQINLRDIAGSESSIAAVIAAVDALIDGDEADAESDRPEEVLARNAALAANRGDL